MHLSPNQKKHLLYGTGIQEQIVTSATYIFSNVYKQMVDWNKPHFSEN